MLFGAGAAAGFGAVDRLLSSTVLGSGWGALVGGVVVDAGFEAAAVLVAFVAVFVAVFVFATFLGASSFAAAVFVLAFPTLFFASTAGASSLTTFLGRPRFLGTVATVESMAAGKQGLNAN